MNHLVSILIPAYNAEHWIADTIESALAQSWPHKEIVIVDDGSSDATLAVARRYASDHVRVLSQPNAGAAAARNAALHLARGDYVQWLDADDVLGPGKIAAQMKIAEECRDPRVLISSAWAYFMYRQHCAKFSPTALWGDLAPVEWMIRKWANSLHMQTATWLVSRQLSEAVGPWDTTLLTDDDGEYFARVVLAAREVRFAPEARVFYRVVGPERLSYVGDSQRKVEAQFRSLQLQIGYLRAVEDSPRVRQAIAAYLQTWLPLFEPERPELVRELNSLAASLGIELKPVRISRKYAALDALLGRRATKRVQRRYNNGKTALLRSLDRMLYALQEK